MQNIINPGDVSRRAFLRGSLLTAGALALGRAYAAPGRVSARRVLPGAKLNIAFVGLGGQGGNNLGSIYGLGENIVALCDVDQTRLQTAAKKVQERCPNARQYADFRVMFERERDLDAVLISTPDHMHAVVAMWAMQRGLNVYCEKPLTRTAWEARELLRLARQSGVVTQMGNHGSASEGLRHGVEVLRAGVIGNVREAHVWTDRPKWPQGIARPAGADPVPPTLDWDLWLGVAPERPYKAKVYHPFVWRGWHDFGAGALGDMGCHTLNLPFHGLRLGSVTEVEAEERVTPMPETYPKGSRVRYTFAARGDLPALKLWWYEGAVRPQASIMTEIIATFAETPKSGCLLIGDKGLLYSPDDYGTKNYLLLKGEEKFMGLAKHPAAMAVPVTLPRAPGGRGGSHHREWTEACKGGPATFSNFETAVPLTEICAVGCLALRLGKRIEWNAAAMTAPNAPEAAPLIRPVYRKGWQMCP